MTGGTGQGGVQSILRSKMERWKEVVKIERWKEVVKIERWKEVVKVERWKEIAALKINKDRSETRRKDGPAWRTKSNSARRSVSRGRKAKFVDACEQCMLI